MLFSAYKELMEGPETAEHHPQALARPEDYEKLMDIYKSAPYPKGAWNVVWAEEYNGWLKDKLLAFLQNDLKSADVVKDTNDKIDQLNKKYKIRTVAPACRAACPVRGPIRRANPRSGNIRLSLR